MKPLASISLDLDNKWSYMKTHGAPSWNTYPSYYNVFVPYILDVLDKKNLNITFFIVGKDASLKSNHEYLRMITDRGHEIGNHAFNHDPAIESATEEQIKKEIMETEEHIMLATNQKPLGFRSPGFSWNRNILKVLTECNYKYDASVFPNFTAPVSRYYYFSNANLTREEKKKLKRLYGSFFDGFRSSKPYCWEVEGKALYEIPVTTFPVIKTPIHFTYLLFLSKSEKVMYTYFKSALSMCNMLGTGLSFLLHPTDLLNSEQVPELSFFPGMNIERSKKLEMFYKVLDLISDKFEIVNMGTHLKSIEKNINIKKVQLS